MNNISKPAKIVYLCTLFIIIILLLQLSALSTIALIILPSIGFGYYLEELDKHYRKGFKQ